MDRMPKLMKQQRIEMRAAGATYQQIADEQGVSRISVQKWFKETERRKILDGEKERRKSRAIPERGLMPECNGCKFAEGARCEIFFEPKYAWINGKCPESGAGYKKRYSNKLVEQCRGCANAVWAGRSRCAAVNEPGWHWRELAAGEKRTCSFRKEGEK